MELLDLSTIYIIFGLPRVGKTCLMSHIANTVMYDFKRTEAMQEVVKDLNVEGFNLEMPPHVVSANYDIMGYKYLCSENTCRRINPYKLGIKEFAPEDADLHLDIPYGVYFIQEAQRYLNSRRSANFPDFQSRWYETLGHNHMVVFLDCQRPGLIDLNVRANASFIEVRDLDVKLNKYGDVKGLKWYIRRIENSEALDTYLQSGRQNTDVFVDDVIEADYNVFEIYDSHGCRGRFYNNRECEKFNFSDVCDDYLPEWFYKKEGKKC